MTNKLPRIHLLLAGLALLAISVSGPGYRLGIWPLSVAFGVLRIGGYVAIALAIVSVVHLLLLRRRAAPSRDVVLVSLAMVIAVIGAAFPLLMMWQAGKVPPIHDITTDTKDPPAFVSIVPLRAAARNPVAYAGESVAAQQRTAYPDIEPSRIAATPAKAFERALAAARAMGWQIVFTSPSEGRIEATDTTLFFGFVDDVVIRVSADGAGSRVDVRSLSRIGRSDLGANARRIRGYLQKLELGSKVLLGSE